MSQNDAKPNRLLTHHRLKMFGTIGKFVIPLDLLAEYNIREEHKLDATSIAISLSVLFCFCFFVSLEGAQQKFGGLRCITSKRKGT